MTGKPIGIMEAAMFDFFEFNCGLRSLIKQAFWELVIVCLLIAEIHYSAEVWVSYG